MPEAYNPPELYATVSAQSGDNGLARHRSLGLAPILLPRRRCLRRPNKLVDYLWIRERARVTEIVHFPRRDATEDAPLIFPDRVFGSCGAHRMTSGAAIGPISRRTPARSSFRSSSVGKAPAFRVTNA
jgi:hypothetical protein